MSVVSVLEQRGFINQMTDTGLSAAADAGRLKCYVGFDPSAPSLHIGNMIPLMGLAHFQRAGHIPIAVIGGGTGMIGDPSGRSDERSLLPLETIRANAERIKVEISRFLDLEGPSAALMVNNIDWLEQINFLDFLRDIGKHFSVNAMVAKESVRARLEDREQGISFTEFSYMLLQAYDFLHLFREFGCTVQAGGSDQWGNITEGIDLIRRLEGAQAHGLTFPLLMTAAGAKFGKSEGGALYLNPEMTSPYKLYQYWINTDDRDVPKYLKLFTFLELREIAALAKELEEKPQERAAHRTLAFDITARVHGEDTAKAVRRASEILFGEAITEIDEATLQHIAGEVPTTTIARARLSAGLGLVDVLADSGLVQSKGAARKLIQQGGANVNNRRIGDVQAALTIDDAISGRAILLRAGKKNYHLLRLA
jgi:tyrosyl-tRNA synthetase